MPARPYLKGLLTVPANDVAQATAVILHGNGLYPAFYTGLATELADRGVACHIPALPGFSGRKPTSPGWHALLEATATETGALLGANGVLVGHSLGGLVALLLAARQPPRALVLLEPAVIPWRALARFGAFLYRAKAQQDAPDRVPNRGPWFWRMHDPDRLPEAVMRGALSASAATDHTTLDALQAGLADLYPLPFDAVRCPTLVVRGASSGPVMAWGQRDLARRLPCAHTAVIPQAGHWLANEQDAALAAAIARFALQAGPPLS